MMYVLLYALCTGRGLYDVTVGIIKRGVVTCRTGIMIMMMTLVVYCLFVCLFCYMSVFSFVGLQYGDCPLMGGGTGESFEMIVSCDSEKLRNSRLCETQWVPVP